MGMLLASSPHRSAMPQVLVGNKCDVDEQIRAVPFSRGQALAHEFGIRFDWQRQELHQRGGGKLVNPVQDAVTILTVLLGASAQPNWDWCSVNQ